MKYKKDSNQTVTCTQCTWEGFYQPYHAPQDFLNNQFLLSKSLQLMSDHISEIPYVRTFKSEQLQLMSDHTSEIPYVRTFKSGQLQFMRDHMLEIPYVRTFKSGQLQFMRDHILEIPYVRTFKSEQLQFMRDHILEIPYVRTFKSEQLQVNYSSEVHNVHFKCFRVGVAGELNVISCTAHVSLNFYH